VVVLDCPPIIYLGGNALHVPQDPGQRSACVLGASEFAFNL